MTLPKLLLAILTSGLVATPFLAGCGSSPKAKLSHPPVQRKGKWSCYEDGPRYACTRSLLDDNNPPAYDLLPPCTAPIVAATVINGGQQGWSTELVVYCNR